MQLTRRGRVVIAVIVVGFAMAWLFGPRALNAVVAPALVAIAAAAYQLRRIEKPIVGRTIPEDDHVGATGTVHLAIDGAGDLPAILHDETDPGLIANGNEVRITLSKEHHSYEVAYAKRGRHRLGPTLITVRDSLGLFSRTYTRMTTDQVTVYPPVYALLGTTRHDLNLLPETLVASERGEFDRLREYERGDSLRDIHWKSSAKRPTDELVVKEFIDEGDDGSVDIVAEGPIGTDDQLAAATASVASYLLSAGMPVGIVTPDARVEPGRGHDQRTAILDALATTGTGTVRRGLRDEADVHISAAASLSDVTVSMGDHTVAFADLLGSVDPEEEEIETLDVATAESAAATTGVIGR